MILINLFLPFTQRYGEGFSENGIAPAAREFTSQIVAKSHGVLLLV